MTNEKRDSSLGRASGVSIVFLIFLFFLFSPWGRAAQEEPAKETPKTPQKGQIEATADDLQYDKNNRKLVGVGNVVVVQDNIQMTADRAELNVDTKEADAEGHVTVRKGKYGALSGERASFNFDTSQGTFPSGRFSFFPWFGHAEHIEQVEDRKIKATNAFITSCPLPHPHWDIHASRTTIYPGDKIVAWNVFFRILEVPVFWLPYLSIPLDYDPIGLTPGYSNRYGGFILGSKGFSINENIKGRLRADWFSKRGFGAGTDIQYKFERLGIGEVKIYGIRDKRAPNQRADNPFEDRSKGSENRGRASWKHKMALDPLTTVQVQWHELSDREFLQDFFEREHREEIDPQSFVTVTRNSGAYSLLGHFEKRTNRFQSVGEKLPEISFTWLRKPLFGTNFYYTNQEGFVNFDQTNAFAADGSNTVQLDTDHELSYPLRFFKAYNFIPFVNFREDYFTKSKSKEHHITRSIGGGGFDASTRFYRTWDYEGKPFGIEVNQLRHVLEPIVQYNSIHLSTVDPRKLVMTGRGDNLDNQDIITFGVENRIQTKRKAGEGFQRVDLVSFNTFLDFNFGPSSEIYKTRNTQFTESRTEITLRPYDWLAFRGNTIVNITKGRLASNDVDLVLDRERWLLALSYRYAFRQEGAGVFSTGEDRSNQFIADTVYRVNDRWNVGGYIRWETITNVLQEAEVRATRDLHDWLLDFGFNIRKSSQTNVKGGTNKEVFFQLRLKALPVIDLHTGHRASFSQPRIGKHISGANEAPLPPSYSVSPDAQYVSLTTP